MVVNKMKANEIRKMSAAELEGKLAELKKDLFMLRMQHATNQLDNPPADCCCQERYCPHQNYYS